MEAKVFVLDAEKRDCIEMARFWITWEPRRRRIYLSPRLVMFTARIPPAIHLGRGQWWVSSWANIDTIHRSLDGIGSMYFFSSNFLRSKHRRSSSSSIGCSRDVVVVVWTPKVLSNLLSVFCVLFCVTLGRWQFGSIFLLLPSFHLSVSLPTRMCIHSWPKSDGVSLIPLFSNFRLFRTNFWMEVTFFFFFSCKCGKTQARLTFWSGPAPQQKLGSFPTATIWREEKKSGAVQSFHFLAAMAKPIRRRKIRLKKMPPAAAAADKISSNSISSSGYDLI